MLYRKSIYMPDEIEEDSIKLFLNPYDLLLYVRQFNPEQVDELSPKDLDHPITIGMAEEEWTIKQVTVIGEING
jgi:hypothetical protein